MTNDRRNIKIDAELFEVLNTDRTDRGLTWPEYLRALKRDADSRTDGVALADEAVDAVGDEVEARLEAALAVAPID